MVKLKRKIIDRIKKIQDESLLEELFKAVELEHEIDSTYELSKEERKAVEEGVKDANQGKTYSHDEASHLVKEWLKK